MLITEEETEAQGSTIIASAKPCLVSYMLPCADRREKPGESVCPALWEATLTVRHPKAKGEMGKLLEENPAYQGQSRNPVGT